MKSKLLILVICCLFSSNLFSQVTQEDDMPHATTRILFIFDASQSMYGQWQSDIKINIARKLFSEILDSLKHTDYLELGLRVYGHQKPYPPQDCDDNKLEVPIGKDNVETIKKRLESIVPSGTTPIAQSLFEAANDFPPCGEGEVCRNIIILITDGIEECDGDPCAVSQALQKQGIILKPFVIGIGRDFSGAFDCVGTYFDASSEKEFQTALNIVISQALNNTTAQVNLMDANGNASETNVNMTFYNDNSGKEMYNYIHTMNAYGRPDTLVIDPLPRYNIVVHTIPPVYSDSSVKLIPGKHTIIPIDAPQGFLKFRMNGRIPPQIDDVAVIIRQQDSTKTLNVQYFNKEIKYITGKYDVEILCLPRLSVYGIDISQSETTTVEIPSPGIVSIRKNTKGYGSVYVWRDGKAEWIHNINPDNTIENLYLQPGQYRIVFRAIHAKHSYKTIIKEFKIESGKSITVNIYN